MLAFDIKFGFAIMGRAPGVQTHATISIHIMHNSASCMLNSFDSELKKKKLIFSKYKL